MRLLLTVGVALGVVWLCRDSAQLVLVAGACAAVVASMSVWLRQVRRVAMGVSPAG